MPCAFGYFWGSATTRDMAVPGTESQRPGRNARAIGAAPGAATAKWPETTSTDARSASRVNRTFPSSTSSRVDPDFTASRNRVPTMVASPCGVRITIGRPSRCFATSAESVPRSSTMDLSLPMSRRVDLAPSSTRVPSS
jgi:hypothetical protein